MLKLFTTCLSIAALATALNAQSTGFMSPTATAAPNGFTNANLAFSSDDQWASVAHQSGCRCPFIYLSWNGGTNYTSPDLLGPFGTTDAIQTAGSSTDLWGHTWTDAELSNTNFRLKIANPSTLIEQGYADFNFNIPNGATINGIEVRLEWHGDANFTMEFLDHAQVNVHYTTITGNPYVATLAEQISFYPNPANGAVTIDTKGIELLTCVLQTIDGKIIMQQTLVNMGSQPAQVSFADVSAGIYLICFVTDKGTLHRKIVVQ